MLKLEEYSSETRIDGSAPWEFFAPTDNLRVTRCVAVLDICTYKNICILRRVNVTWIDFSLCRLGPFIHRLMENVMCEYWVEILFLKKNPAEVKIFPYECDVVNQ